MSQSTPTATESLRAKIAEFVEHLERLQLGLREPVHYQEYPPRERDAESVEMNISFLGGRIMYFQEYRDRFLLGLEELTEEMVQLMVGVAGSADV